MQRLSTRALMLLALAAPACATAQTVPDAPDAPAPAPEMPTPADTGATGLPTGQALHDAVLGRWTGTAHDGTATTEEVSLELSDTTYELEAGVFDNNTAWAVTGDIIFLEQDGSEFTEDGMCFRATKITAREIIGNWTWGKSATECDTHWYELVLVRSGD